MPQLPAYDDWKWPWDKGQVDEEKAARLVYNARLAEQNALSKVASKDEEIAQLKNDLDTEKARQSEADPKVQEQLAGLLKENRELKASQGKARPEDQLQIDRLKVALEKGLTAKQADRLVGTDYESLSEDADVLLADLGLSSDEDKGEVASATTVFGEIPAPRARPTRQGQFSVTGGEVKSDPAAAAKILPPLT